MIKKLPSVIVLGCAQGLGSNIAQTLSQRFHVVLADKADTDLLRKEIVNKGGQADSLQVDFNNIPELQKKLTGTLRNTSCIGAVFVARARTELDFLKVSESDWDTDLSVNLKSCFFAAQALFPLFTEAENFFITVSSINSTRISHQSPGYHCSKAALEQLTRYLAIAGGKYKVRVNSVQPGFIIADKHFARYNDPQNKSYKERAEFCHPLSKVGTHEEVSKVVQFLTSAESAFINGSIIPVDGGLSLHEPFHLVSEWEQAKEKMTFLRS